MKTELKRICENQKIVSVYCDEDSSKFIVGYICAVGSLYFLIKGINRNGFQDGYILKRIEDIVHLEKDGEYEKKIESLYKLRGTTHKKIDITHNEELLEQTLLLCQKAKNIVTLELIEDDDYPLRGQIISSSDVVIINKITDYGKPDGEAIVKKESINTLSFLGMDEEDLLLLSTM